MVNEKLLSENKSDIMSSLYDLVNPGKEFSSDDYVIGAYKAEKLGLDQTAMVLYEKSADLISSPVKAGFDMSALNYSPAKSFVTFFTAYDFKKVSNLYEKASILAEKLGYNTKSNSLKKSSIIEKNKSEIGVPKPTSPASAAA